VIDLSYNEEEDILYVINRGKFIIRNVIDVSRDIMENYAHLNVLYNLDDFRDMEYQFHLNSVFVDMSDMRASVADLAQSFDEVYTVVIFKQVANEGLLNFFLNLRKPKNYHIRVFFDYEEGKQWLQEQQQKHKPNA
jgi:hypothetical protein